MKKKHWIVILILSIVAMISCQGLAIVYGMDLSGVPVYAYIQSYDKELAQGSVQAVTFKEAIQKLSSANDIQIVFSQDNAKSVIYSVNDIQNGFLRDGGWYGYIIRGDGYLKPDEFLDTRLENGDEVILYYGDFNATKIITDLTVSEREGLVAFNVSSAYTLWSKGDDRWEKDTVAEKLQDVKIHLILPGGARKILKTNNMGIVSTSINKMGLYKYYAESYVSGGIPLAVSTKDQFFSHGFHNENQITRAEATAFIVNHFGTARMQTPIPFSDVSNDIDFYSEINTAASAGVIAGFGDGTFRPDEPVSQLQLVIMLSQVYNGKTSQTTIDRSDVPAWAADVINPAVYYNLLANEDINWSAPVTVRLLQQIYTQI